MRRLEDLSPGRIVGIAGLIGLGFLVVWTALSAVAWAALHLVGVDADFWPALESLSTAATLATIIGGGVVALAQLVEANDSREREIAATNLEAYNTIFEQMMSDENIDARRWIYVRLPDDPEQGVDSLSDEGRRSVKLVLNSFDRLGFMLQEDLISSEAIIKWVSPFVVKVWAKVGPYVDYEVQRRKEPDYYEAARFLAERCQAWRTGHVPDAEITWLNNAL
jgi:hypothetical protein